MKKATKQISNSINFLKQNNITVKNAQNHSIAINVSEQDLRNAHKVIIYMPRNSLIDKDNRSIKFYTSKKSGNIHIFNIDDYRNICNALITPSELDEYLKFREIFYLKYKDKVKLYSEEYILSHFISNPSDYLINEDYIKNLDILHKDIASFDMSPFLEDFLKKYVYSKTKRND